MPVSTTNAPVRIRPDPNGHDQCPVLKPKAGMSIPNKKPIPATTAAVVWYFLIGSLIAWWDLLRSFSDKIDTPIVFLETKRSPRIRMNHTRANLPISSLNSIGVRCFHLRGLRAIAANNICNDEPQNSENHSIISRDTFFINRFFNATGILN